MLYMIHADAVRTICTCACIWPNSLEASGSESHLIVYNFSKFYEKRSQQLVICYLKKPSTGKNTFGS